MSNAMTLLINADASKAKGELKGLGGGVDEVGAASARTTLRTAAMGAALAALVVGLAHLTGKAIDAADAIAKLSEITGISTEKLSGLKLAAGLAGTSVESLAGGIRKLQKGMLDAATKGTGPVNDALGVMGIELRDAEGNLRSTEAVMADVADTFSLMENGAVKAGLAQDLMGRSGTQMIPLLNQGADAMSRLHQESVALGVVWSEDDTQAAEDFNDAILRLKTAGDGMVQTFAMSWIPLMADIAVGAAIATEALLVLGKTQRQMDAERTEAAQDQINDADNRLRGLERNLRAWQQMTAAELAEMGETEAFRDMMVATWEERVERQKSLVVSLANEFGAEAGILTKQAKLLREQARLRAEAATSGRVSAPSAVGGGGTDDGTAQVLKDRERAAADLKTTLDSLAAVMVQMEAASLSGVDKLSFELAQRTAAIELQRDALLSNEMLSQAERLSVREASAQAIVAIEADTSRQIEALHQQAVEGERAASEERIRIREREGQQAVGYAMSTMGSVSTFAGQIGDLVTALYGEQTEEGKKAAKAAFVTQQIVAIAQATISMFVAIAKANELGYPQSIAAMIAAGFTGGVQIAGIAGTTIAGIADAGMLPGALSKAGFGQHSALFVRDDEMVTDPATTKDLGRTVQLTNQILSGRQSSGGGEVTIPIVVNVDGDPVYEATEKRRIRARERGISHDDRQRYGEA